MNGNPIIFLDIDGVLNSELYHRSTYGDKEERILAREIAGEKSYDEMTREEKDQVLYENAINNIDPKGVEFLNTLIKSTGAKVVMSSTWRIGREIEELQALLDARGFEGEVISKTPRGPDISCRGDEIYKWIQDNQELTGCFYADYTRYVILDDDSDMLLWQQNNFIKIDGYCGLSPNTTYQAEWILNGTHNHE